jgi:hypothetical protein
MKKKVNEEAGKEVEVHISWEFGNEAFRVSFVSLKLNQKFNLNGVDSMETLK